MDAVFSVINLIFGSTSFSAISHNFSFLIPVHFADLTDLNCEKTRTISLLAVEI